MKNRPLFRNGLVSLVALFIANAGFGYVVNTDESGVYTLKWYSTPVVMQVKLSTTADLLDGSSPSSSVMAAMQAWNGHVGTVQFSATNASGDYAIRNQVNEIALDTTVGGDAFPTDVLAVTVRSHLGNEVVECDIVFNDAYRWNSYRGSLRPDAADIRRVAVHELGHVLGLDHPDEHGQTEIAIMNSQISDIETPQSDDRSGAQVLYGVPGVRPANDNFANAKTLSLTVGTIQATGSNIGATRESGESGHGGATSTHSTWWKWTAPAAGTLTVDTLGSDFDTVLAAYTGSSVSSLTTIASNDDEEMPDQDSTPQRKRTSKVSFAVAGGTTYRVAVDGWGDTDHLPAGYTGAITLNLSFTTEAVAAPVITSQPLSRTIVAGGNASLTVGATGNPAPAYQWRRNGSNIIGATSAALTLANMQPANTGLYTAQVSSGLTTITSNPAIVGLTTSSRVIGSGRLVNTDVPHPNGKRYDQVLVTGAAESITADYAQNRITRTSFIDLNGDIVQVELAGPGTLSLALDAAGEQAEPEKYNQPKVLYVKGHAGIVITGADERTNVSVFTVGRATAFDPTGAYDILKGISATNDPAKNGSPLFTGHPSSDYDGVADIAFIAISSSNGKFGGVRGANASFAALAGFTGIYAPGVAFSGPVFVGDITAFGSARPVLVLGSASDVRVTGGNLFQDNGQPVQASGITQLKFTNGSDSHGRELPAQSNRAVLQQNGRNVTSQIVVNPD